MTGDRAPPARDLSSTDGPDGGHGPPVSASRLALAPELAPDIAPAFAAAYREHHAFVWRILRHLGVAPAQLDDRLQDVFLVVYRRWHTYDPASSMRSWLYGIARRVAADQRRAERRSERRLQAVAPPSPGAGPEQALAQAEAEDFVDDFLAGLDPEKREVFVLAEVEHLSAPDIAAATGVKLNTVYSRLRVARELFSRAIERRVRAERRDHAPRR